MKILIEIFDDYNGDLAIISETVPSVSYEQGTEALARLICYYDTKVKPHLQPENGHTTL